MPTKHVSDDCDHLSITTGAEKPTREPSLLWWPVPGFSPLGLKNPLTYGQRNLPDELRQQLDEKLSEIASIAIRLWSALRKDSFQIDFDCNR